MLQLPPNLPKNANLLPICGVVAVAAMAKVSYLDAWGVIAANRRGNWKGYTTNQERETALRSLGAKTIYLKSHVGIRLHLWCERLQQENVHYMVEVTGHVISVYNEYEMDQYGIKPIALSEYLGKRIRQVHRRGNEHG